MTRRSSRHDKADDQALARVLVADDELLIAKGICSSLSKLGYGVVGPASDGRRAVELAHQEKPDLALLDIRMPEMDGLEAAQVLYEELGLPVVIASAYSDETYVNRAAQRGVFGYIIKPVTTEALGVALKVAWAHFQKMDGLVGEVEALRLEMEQRKVIEKAKGVVMRRMNLNEDEAMKHLQKHSRDTRRPLIQVASSLLEADMLFNSPPS